MKLTIDTQVDNHEDIQKVLHILTNILQRNEVKSVQEEPVNTTPMMSMFNTPEPKKDTAPDFNSLLNLAKAPEKKEETKIQYF